VGHFSLRPGWIDSGPDCAYALGMELHLEPELAAKVEQWSAETGLPVNHLIEDAITGYFSEVEQIVSGRVQPMDGREAVRLIKERAAVRRKSIA